MKVLILGLDTFAQKNQAQLQRFAEKGYRFDVVTSDLRGDSKDWFTPFIDEGHRLYCLRGGVLRRIVQVLGVMRSVRHDVVELYATGRLASLWVLLLRVRRVPFVVIERGDIGLWNEYSPLTRWSMALSYRHANLVVYRETFMPDLLTRFRPRALAFQPNCVRMPSGRTEDTQRRFLWVNRIHPRRRPQWLVRQFANRRFREHQLTMMGLEERADISAARRDLQNDLAAIATENVELLPFADPTAWYQKSTFFCFPAERVFGNNALLEAMSWGLIPIVTSAPGVELIVEDGVNGIVTDLDEASYSRGLARAVALDTAELRSMSEAARETVRTRYSMDSWATNMDRLYRSIL